MKTMPGRLRRLDDALASLPLEDPMLLTELDGFLTGLVLCPDPVSPHAWLPSVWGEDNAEVPPFEEPADAEWFRAALIARQDEIRRDLARGRFLPILDFDDRQGELLWEPWIDALDMAMALHPQSRTDARPDVAEALATLALLVAVARNESGLEAEAVNAIHDGAAEAMVAAVQRVFAARAPAEAPSAPVAAKIGRNDPCPCGSGKKFKKCCG